MVDLGYKSKNRVHATSVPPPAALTRALGTMQDMTVSLEEGQKSGCFQLIKK